MDLWNVDAVQRGEDDDVLVRGLGFAPFPLRHGRLVHAEFLGDRGLGKLVLMTERDGTPRK